MRVIQHKQLDLALRRPKPQNKELSGRRIRRCRDHACRLHHLKAIEEQVNEATKSHDLQPGAENERFSTASGDVAMVEESLAEVRSCCDQSMPRVFSLVPLFLLSTDKYALRDGCSGPMDTIDI